MRTIVQSAKVLRQQVSAGTRRATLSSSVQIAKQHVSSVGSRARWLGTQSSFGAFDSALHSQNSDMIHCQQQQRRSMVVVSQHKAGDVAMEDISAATQSATPITSSSSEATSEFPINNDQFPVEEGKLENRFIITESCWSQLERLATKKGHALEKVYLRVFVDAGGCSGFTYQFEYHSLEDTDDIIDDEKEDMVWLGPGGARVVVDVGSMDFLKGATLDYVVEMIKSSFEIRENPQSESACGCGSSFAVKNFSANPALD